MVTRTLATIIAIAMFAGPAAAASVDEGQQLSMKHCSKCHGQDGKGHGSAIDLLGITPPPTDWTDKAEMSKMTDASMTQIINMGGKALGKSSHMPPYKGKFTDDQIASMVLYIRSLAK